MNLSDLATLPKPLHQVGFLLSILLKPSPTPLSECRYVEVQLQHSGCYMTCWCFQSTCPHFPLRRQDLSNKFWQACCLSPLLPATAKGAVLMWLLVRRGNC